MLNMRRVTFISLALLTVGIFAARSAPAQLRLPRPSPGASVKLAVGVTDITIDYSRPAVKGRTIWGTWPEAAKGEATLDNQNTRPAGAPIVPYGHIWRTGANEATQFAVTDAVLINGQSLAAGDYSLHTIPGKDEWTIVFNDTANQWGSFSYDPSKDTLRIKAKPVATADTQEWLNFSIDPAAANSAVVNIRWEKLRVPFTVEVDVAATTLAHARQAIASAKADDWRTPFQAAGFANQNGAKDDAVKWIDQSLKILDASIASKETFQNLSAKANVLLAAGRNDAGIAAAEKAIARGKADGADTAALEKRIADLKAPKK